MLEIAKAIVLWLFYLPAIYMSGSLFNRWIKEDDPVIKGIFYYAFGLGLWGMWIVVIGTVGCLYSWSAYAGILCFSLLGLRSLQGFPKWLGEIAESVFLTPTNKFGTYTRIVFAVTMLISFLACFAPEIANDSLAYHLYLPKMFIKNHSVLPLFFDEKSWRSLFMEELFVFPLFFKSIPAAILFHWTTIFFLIIAMIRVFQKHTAHYETALFLSTIFWLTPTLFNQASISYSDGGVALFTFLGFYFFINGKIQSSLRDCFLSGILLGISIGCKWLTLQFILASYLWLGLDALFYKKWKKNFALIMINSVGIFLTASYWFIRNTIMTGSPLYPLFTHKFGSTGLYAEQKFATIGVTKNLFNFFALPFLASFQPMPFNQYHWIGPLYTLLVPCAAWGAFKNPKARPYFFISFVVTALWFLSAQDIRFLLSIFPLMLLSCVYGFNDLRERFNSKILHPISVVCLLALFGYLALGIRHYRAQLIYLIKHESREVFLRHYDRAYPAAEWINQHLPAHAVIFNANEVHHLYFKPRLIDAWMFYRIYRNRPDWNEATLITLLKQQGVTHILRNEIIPASSKGGSNLYPFLDNLLKNSAKTEFLTEIRSQNIRESQYVYTVYRLK
ncbi:MAG: hypothetical protein EXS63_01220 [Candidatus Omnitrophica bacterium]|nr:hypothetical protein [Candidatus Omnitrophota bacterium]